MLQAHNIKFFDVFRICLKLLSQHFSHCDISDFLQKMLKSDIRHSIHHMLIFPRINFNAILPDLREIPDNFRKSVFLRKILGHNIQHIFSTVT